MFPRMVKTENGTTALFPFQRLSHSFSIGGFDQEFDPDKERAANNDVRKLIKSLKERIFKYVDRSNPKAVSKARHYARALDDQLLVCARVDEVIDTLCDPFPSRRP